jgi:hypothetical protein
MSWMDVLDGILDRPKPRCDVAGPDDARCLLAPLHVGFHKSNHHAWPNQGDDPRYWAEMREQVLTGGPLAPMSYVEIEYALRYGK